VQLNRVIRVFDRQIKRVATDRAVPRMVASN
jgi:hypothetical protein